AYRVGDFHQDDMASQRQEYAEAEKCKRMLSAQDDRLQDWALEQPSVARYELYCYSGQCEKVDQTQDVEGGLVDRIHDVGEPFGHEVCPLRNVPRHHNQKRE